ncbi:MAG TPA: HD domain-containing phosphohydrolase, partial [Anaerolineales bacterium]|nr:HD domain-containing phosphohydrolase [Anaerolineales bacterium]
TKDLDLPGLVIDDILLRRVISEQQMIYIPDIREEKLSECAQLIEDEGFVSCYGVPLISNAQSLGALEVWHRAPLMLDSKALVFLKILAGEAVLAMNSTHLLRSLQESNRELIFSYEAPLEGWVRAMDLRDRETEGHSQRVTELTLRLARQMGISDEQLVHMRRGALLHDIGKLGIPDAILHKPARLSEEELKMLKQHPTLGYHLLSPIPFLQPALDIVYCHHERWDGSGYPRGLRGEEIPLAARIFAVVDVWDALVAERAFRHSSSKEEAMAYLKDQAGKTLDPHVVEAFVAVIHG